MIYVIYLFAGLFIILSATMLYVFYRTSHFGIFLMGTTYGASGLIAILIGQWWPLAAGFALVWILKLMGLEPPVEPARDEGGGKGAEWQDDSRSR